MLEVKNLTVTYPEAAKPVFADISFAMQAGEMLRLEGANGSGKTTLLYSLCNAIPQEIPAQRQGTVLLNERDMTSIPLNMLIPDMMLVLQNPAWQLFFPTVQDEIVYALENIGLTTAEIRARLDDALTCFRLNELAKAIPAQLSLGGQKLLTLAVAYAIQPKVLLLDEPLNNLAADNKVLVIDWLREYCQQGGILIAAEHDPVFATLHPQSLLLPSAKRG